MKFKHKDIKCPRCGNTDLRRMRWLEDIVVYRGLHGVEGGKLMSNGAVKNGVLMIDGAYHSGEGYDDGTNGRIECLGVGELDHAKDCFHEWRPAALNAKNAEGKPQLEIDWVV